MLRASVFSLALLSLALAGPVDDFESRVTEFKLANGLPVLVYTDSSAPVVTVAVAYKVGSNYEPAGKTGLSHMLEHMTFQHSDIYKPGEFFRIIQANGGVNNGFTSGYYTAYFEVFAREKWELGMKIEASRMGRCVFLDSDFASEHQVVAEEQRLSENSPSSVFWTQLNAAALLAHPARNPTVGWADDVAQFTTDAVRDWYGHYYSPSNALLVVAGDIRPDEVRPKAEKYFGKYKARPVVLPDFYNSEPKQVGERRMTVRKVVTQPSLAMAFHAPGIRDSAFYAALVAGSALGQGRGSRLYQRLVIDSGLAASASAYSESGRDPGLFWVDITPKAESLIPRIERVVDAEIGRMGREPITDRELQRVKNQIVADYIYSRDAIMWMAIILGDYQLTRGSWREFKLYPENIAQVTAAQVQDFCRNSLVADNRTVGTLLPMAQEEK
jgi:zinc protease